MSTTTSQQPALRLRIDQLGRRNEELTARLSESERRLRVLRSRAVGGHSRKVQQEMAAALVQQSALSDELATVRLALHNLTQLLNLSGETCGLKPAPHLKADAPKSLQQPPRLYIAKGSPGAKHAGAATRPAHAAATHPRPQKLSITARHDAPSSFGGGSATSDATAPSSLHVLSEDGSCSHAFDADHADCEAPVPPSRLGSHASVYSAISQPPSRQAAASGGAQGQTTRNYSFSGPTAIPSTRQAALPRLNPSSTARSAGDSSVRSAEAASRTKAYARAALAPAMHVRTAPGDRHPEPSASHQHTGGQSRTQSQVDSTASALHPAAPQAMAQTRHAAQIAEPPSAHGDAPGRGATADASAAAGSAGSRVGEITDWLRGVARERKWNLQVLDDLLRHNLAQALDEAMPTLDAHPGDCSAGGRAGCADSSGPGTRQPFAGLQQYVEARGTRAPFASAAATPGSRADCYRGLDDCAVGTARPQDARVTGELISAALQRCDVLRASIELLHDETLPPPPTHGLSLQAAGPHGQQVWREESRPAEPPQLWRRQAGDHARSSAHVDSRPQSPSAATRYDQPDGYSIADDLTTHDKPAASVQPPSSSARDSGVRGARPFVRSSCCISDEDQSMMLLKLRLNVHSHPLDLDERDGVDHECHIGGAEFAATHAHNRSSASTLFRPRPCARGDHTIVSSSTVWRAASVLDSIPEFDTLFDQNGY